MTFGLHAASGRVTSPDGTPIAWFREAADRADLGAALAPLVLVHGTTADHTTFRRFGPRMAAGRPVISIDRRGRGAPGDTLPYSIEREFEDVAAVAEAVTAEVGTPIDVFGHSFGGRCALGAALLTDSIRRVAVYEGAVEPDVGQRQPELVARLERLLAEDRPEALLEVFLREGVDFTDDEWDAFRTSPTYPTRVAAAHTVPRELRAGATNGSALERYIGVRQPVLVVIGSESPPYFAEGARRLAGGLRDGRLEVIEGARHAATHTHIEELAAVVETFLDGPDG